MIIRKKDIIEIVDILSGKLSTKDLYELVYKLDLDTDYIAQDLTEFNCLFTRGSLSISSMLKQLICNISDIGDPDNLMSFLKLLNLTVDCSMDIDILNSILTVYGIVIDKSDCKARLTQPILQSNLEEGIEFSWPDGLKGKLVELIDRFREGDFSALAASCRSLLNDYLVKEVESFAGNYEFSEVSGYKVLLDKMEDKGLLRDKEAVFSA